MNKHNYLVYHLINFKYMKLKNIRIGTKLSLTLGAMAFIALVVGGIGYFQLSKLSSSMNNIGMNRIPDLTDYLSMNVEG